MVYRVEFWMPEVKDPWIERLRARDENTLGELVRTYSGPLRRYLSGMLRNPSDGEDLAQETLMRFLENLNSFRGESSVKTFLFRIAHNLALNRLVSAASQHEVFPGELPEGRTQEASPQRDLIREESAAAVRRALALLPPQQRAVVILRNWEDLTFKEIARVLSLAEGTAKAHYFFALRNLRKHMEGSHEP
jgi:RNA polymerase sigma-70 factor (ECF subfamily)